MPVKEVKTEVVKMGKGLAILLPECICEDNIIKEGSELKIIYTQNGRFEVRSTDLAANQIKCGLCNERTSKYTCSICGATACSNCFWEFGNICNKCIGK